MAERLDGGVDPLTVGQRHDLLDRVALGEARDLPGDAPVPHFGTPARLGALPHTGAMLVARRPESVSAREGARAAAAGRVVIYWRRGCPFTQRLLLRLGRRAARAVWVDIWGDPEAAAYVHTNPPPRQVLDALTRSR